MWFPRSTSLPSDCGRYNDGSFRQWSKNGWVFQLLGLLLLFCEITIWAQQNKSFPTSYFAFYLWLSHSLFVPLQYFSPLCLLWISIIAFSIVAMPRSQQRTENWYIWNTLGTYKWYKQFLLVSIHIPKGHC